MTANHNVDLSGVAKLYTRSLKEHGATPLGVGWRDASSHALRFSKLLTVLESKASPEPLVINELGCGYGAFAKHMIDAGVPIRLFRGYDISPDMLAEAPQHAVVASEWIQSATLNEPGDYSFTSGIFNVKLGHDENSWCRYVESILLNMQQYSRRGFAFNLLSTYVDYREDHLFYGDPLYFFDFCKRNCSRFVTLLHDYPLYEWTITVRM